ncbi:MAG: hypothetical protein JO053_13580 [Acidobacteria bacterium]|nr:hypothetical protein [Acidobacteriota bacterium]
MWKQIKNAWTDVEITVVKTASSFTRRTNKIGTWVVNFFSKRGGLAGLGRRIKDQVSTATLNVGEVSAAAPAAGLISVKRRTKMFIIRSSRTSRMHAVHLACNAAVPATPSSATDSVRIDFRPFFAPPAFDADQARRCQVCGAVERDLNNSFCRNDGHLLSIPYDQRDTPTVTLPKPARLSTTRLT